MSKLYIITFIIFLASSLVWAQDNIEDRYDENTEMTIKGHILEVVIPKRGPVIVKVKSDRDGKTYNLITAPTWFLAKNNISFIIGDYVEIIGSKLINDRGELFLITRKCKMKDTHSWTFRDTYMRPHWRGGLTR